MKVLVAALLSALAAIHCCGARAAAAGGFFPESFPDTNISQYTVRYVSTYGQDTEECLQNQPYPPPPSFSGDCQQPADPESAISHCRTIGYSVLENCTGMNYTNCTAGVTSNLIVMFYPGAYFYYDDLSVDLSVIVQNYTNLMIRKVPSCLDEVVFSCTRFTNSVYNNLYFIAVINLAIDGIVFSRCGPYSPGAAMNITINATFTNCEFRENLNSGYVAYTSYNMVFQNCVFRDNKCTLFYDEGNTLAPGDYRYAGGLTLLWRIQPEPATVLIKNCTFINNTASVSSRNMADAQVRPNFYIPRGHGGAIVASFNRTENHTILIEDSFITNNTARFNGGGIFASFYDRSHGNDIIVNRTVFEGNNCTNVGGGISMNTFEVADSNRLWVENSRFTNNSAWAGGGACTVNLQDNLVEDNRNSVINNVGIFKNCTFERNYSPEGGSTVSLVSNARADQVSAPSTFTDCKFLYNVANNNSDGTLMGFRFPLTLEGTNVFRGNIGGGVSLLQSHLNSFGHTLFEDNIAARGGGIELRDSSVLHLYNGTTMDFVNNSASRGGAISVQSASVGIDNDIIRLFNTRCFVQYEVENTAPHMPPSEWNVHFTFINNTADSDGAAIYATDVERCTYAPSLNASTPSNSYTRSIFKLDGTDGIFSFQGNTVISPNKTVHRVGTAPSWFKVEPKSIEGAPGEIVTFELSAVDESNNWQDAIWRVSREEEENEFGEEFFSLKAGKQTYNYTICAQTKKSCVPSKEVKLRFSLVQIIAGSVSNVTLVNLTVRSCHPGYYNESGNRCLVNRTDLILREGGRNRYVYIRRQFYAAYNLTGSKALVHAVIPIPFQKCVNNDSNLSGCFFKYDSPDEQCSQGRTGFLCGQCPSGQGVDLTLIQCVECSVRDTILVAIVVILFVVMCALVLIYNIGIPNELRGCLFFIQVVGFVYQYRVGDEHATWDYHLSGVFGSSLYLPLCPLPGTNALYTTAYGMLLPILAVITIIVYIISARFIKHLSNKNSFDGIWLLTFIIYKFTADTCFSILRCQRVVSDDHSESDFRYYYNGNYKCFTTEDIEHLCFAVVALILGVMVILFPVVVLLISFRRFKMTQQLTDVLNKDLKASCRWWGSFDLFRRLLFILVVLIFNYSVPLYSQVALLFSGVFVFFTFACSKPYNSTKANFIEGFVLLDLLILTSLFLDTSEQKQPFVRGIGYILLLAPFISMVLYIAAVLFAYVWRRWCPMTLRSIFVKRKERLLAWTPAKKFVVYETELLDDMSTELMASSANYVDTDTDELQADYSKFREELL